MKGPVAIAGSIPLFSSIIGMKVPINEAVIITEIKEIATVSPNIISRPNNNIPPATRIIASINPFNRLSKTSFTRRFHSEPLKLSFAKPCKTIAED